MRPAERLKGLTLSDGWKVLKQVARPSHATGGGFSVGYLVEHESGEQGYLKALDFSKALQAPDPARELQSMTVAYNFERDLLAKCKSEKLQRVVTPLADGTVKVPGNFGDLGTVCYLVFELSKGDIRDAVEQFAEFDLAWCLRSLHHTAVGLNELHLVGISHQDLKPSNVLVFSEAGSKVTDLGRASDSALHSSADDCQIPGDVGYAPPELFYSRGGTRQFSDRCIADLYLLGSLFFFYFGDCSATQAIQIKIKGFKGINFTGLDFAGDLPHIVQAFQEALLDLEEQLTPIAGKLTPDIIETVSQLCEPNPTRRGDPKGFSTLRPQHWLERYVSRLDLLARKAELSIL